MKYVPFPSPIMFRVHADLVSYVTVPVTVNCNFSSGVRNLFVQVFVKSCVQ